MYEIDRSAQITSASKNFNQNVTDQPEQGNPQKQPDEALQISINDQQSDAKSSIKEQRSQKSNRSKKPSVLAAVLPANLPQPAAQARVPPQKTPSDPR